MSANTDTNYKAKGMTAKSIGKNTDSDPSEMSQQK